MGYNKKVLSKAVSELGKAKAPAKPKDIITDPAGQWKFPGQKTRIPGNDITMQGVNYPVWGQPNVGKGSMMQPGQNYLFPGADYVDETPMAKKGGTLNSKKYSKSMSATNKLFAKNKLFQNKKSKIFDPNSKFKSGGSKLGPINLDPNPLSHYELNYGYNLPTEQDGGVRGNPWLYTYNQESEDRAPGQVIGLGADFQHKSGLHGSTNVELPFFNKNAIGNLYSELGYNKRFKNFDADATLKNYTEPGSKFNPSFTTGIGYNKNLGNHVGFGVGVNNTMVPGNLWNPNGNVSLKYNFQDGGENEDEYMDLTDEEIQAYRDAGYEVDEAPEYETGGFVQHELVKAQKGRTIIHTNKAAYDRANAAESDSLSLYNSANREYNNAMKNIDYFKMFGPTPPSDLIIDKNGNVQEKREFKDPAIIASNVYNKNKKNPIRPVSFYLTGNSGAGSVLEAVKYKKPVIHNVYEEPISTLPLRPIQQFISPEQTIIPARPYVKPKQYSGPRFGTLAGDENLDLPDGATQQEIEAARRQRHADEFTRKTLEYQAKQRGNKPIVKAQTGLTKKPLLISDPKEFAFRNKMYNDSLSLYNASQKTIGSRFPKITEEKFNEIRKKNDELPAYIFDKKQQLEDKKNKKEKPLNEYVVKTTHKNMRSEPVFIKNKKPQPAWNDPNKFAIPLKDGTIKIPGYVIGDKPEFSIYTIYDPSTGSRYDYLENFYSNKKKPTLLGVSSDTIKPVSTNYYGEDFPTEYDSFNITEESQVNGKTTSNLNNEYKNFFYQLGAEDVYAKPVQPVQFLKTNDSQNENSILPIQEEKVDTLPLKPIERFTSPEQTIIPGKPYVKPFKPRYGTLAGDENLGLSRNATQFDIEAARRKFASDEFTRKTLEYQNKQRGTKAPITQAFQKGGTRKPLEISDPKEFAYRNKMYADSLTLYNQSLDDRKWLNSHTPLRISPSGKPLYRGSEWEKYRDKDHEKFYNAKKRLEKANKKAPKGKDTDFDITGTDRSRPEETWGTWFTNYKKPVQPVTVKKAEVIQQEKNTVDSLPLLPIKNIQTLNPEFIPQRTVQPKSYSNPNRHGVWSDKQLPRILSPENWLNKTREYQEQQRGVKQPVSQIRKEGGVLDSYQKKGEVKTFKRDIRDQDALSNTGWGTAPVQKKKVQPTVKQKQAQKSFDKNFKVTDKSKYEKTEDKIVKAQQDLKDWGKENGVAVTDSDLKSVADQQWSFAGVGPQKQPDMMQATPEQSNSSRAWEYMTNPFTALKYEISGGGYENMPHHINEMRMAGINPDKNNLVGNMLNALNPLDDIKTIYEGVNDITKGDNSGYTTAGLGLLGFIPGGDYFKGLRKTGKTAETIKDVSKVDDELLKAYNLAVDLKNRGKISNIPNTPQDFDKWLQAQYNKRPLYRTVDVNPETMANPIIREGIRKQGLDPDNPHHVAEYMGTTVAPATVVNRGRRSGGHDELLQGSNKDIMYYAEDPEWIGPRYGGKNPYYVKVHADELPEGLENQVLGLRSESRVRKNYNRNYPQFDINKVPSGALFEDKYLSVGPNTITPILGDKGAKIRKSVSVLSGADFDKLSNKRFDQGGSTEEWEDELDDNQIERLRRAGYTVDELDEVEDVDTYQAGGPTVSQLWKEHTGTDWSEAHRQGLTSGSYADNMKLRDRILNSEFDNMTPGNNIQQNRVKSQNHRDAYVKNVQNLINNNKSLDDLVSMRMGTREGLLNLFPNLGSAKAPVNKPVANTVLPVNNKPVSKPAVKVDRRMAATSSPNSKLPQLKVFDKQVKTVKPKVKEVRSVNINKSATSSPESFNLDKYRTLTDIQQRFADAKKYNVANKIKQKEKVLKKEDKSVQWQMPQLGINAPTPKAKYPTNINNAASNFNTKNKNQKVLPGKKLKEVDRGIMATYINPIVKEVSAPINSALNTLYDVGESIGEKTESTLGKVGELYESYKKEGLINALTQAKNSQKDPEVYKTVIKPKAKIVKPIPQAKEEAYDNDRLAENYQNITDAGNYTINTFSKKLSGVPLGVRNREDERDIKGKAIAYTYAPFKTYNEHLGNSYGGISLKPNSVETDNQPVIVYDNDKMYIDTFKNQKNTGKLISPTYKTDSVTDLVIDKSNRYSSNIEQKMIKLKTARGDKDIPVGTADSSEGSFKDWSGGHLMLENPKTKEVVVIHGKSYELQKMFRKFLQENKLKSANIIETDHKAYSLIKNPKNNILTGEFNRARDNANTKSSGSGNFIYSKI